MAKGWRLGQSSVEEVFEMAALVEQGGYEFYERLIAGASSRRVQAELGFLRDEEAAHKAFFLEQLRLLGRTARGTVGPELNAVLQLEFFQPLQELFSSSAPDDNFKALGFGMALEQKSIDLYGEMKAVVSETQKAGLDRIIAEEEGHLRKLQFLRARY
jgi:rubrerythrin